MVSSMIRMPAVTVAAHRAYLEVGRRHIRPVSNHTHHGDFGHASCHEVRLQQCGLAKARGDGYVLEALLPFKNRAAAALAVAERMDASLASAVMGKLAWPVSRQVPVCLIPEALFVVERHGSIPSVGAEENYAVFSLWAN